MFEELSLSAELARLWRLAWPTMLGMVGYTIMDVVDSFMVAPLGKQALAGMSISVVWSIASSVFSLGLVHGLEPILAQAHGGSDRRSLARALVYGAILSIVASLPAIVLHLCAASFVHALGQPSEVLPTVTGFCTALAWGVPGGMLFEVVRGNLQCQERVRSAAVAVVVANIINAGADYALIHGSSLTPQLGAIGCGYATSVSRWFMVALLLVLERRAIRAQLQHYVGGDLGGWLSRTLRVAVPVAAQNALEAWGYGMATLIVGWFGVAQLAVNNIAANLLSVSFIASFAVATAASVRVGNIVGAGGRVKLAVGVALAFGAIVSALPVAVLLIAPMALIQLYTADPDVIANARRFLPVAAAFPFVLGMFTLLLGILRGLGDVRVPALVSAVAFIVIGLPGGYLVAHALGGNAGGVWAGLSAALALACIVFGVRVRRAWSASIVAQLER
jgi:MATE family multidrug resistance protein